MASSLPERLRDATLRCCGDEVSEESEAAARREFVEILSSLLYDVELRRASATQWLAQCEQVLQQAVELLDPSASSDLACQDYCLSIIEGLAENCCPREMFAAFMEFFHAFRGGRLRVFRRGVPGFLHLMHLAAQDGGNNDEDEEDEESNQAMDGHNMVPLKQVRAALVHDIVQVVQVSEKLAML